MLKWEEVTSDFPGAIWAIGGKTMRAKVPGGWLVMTHWGTASGLTFLPDPNHEWDGLSLE